MKVEQPSASHPDLATFTAIPANWGVPRGQLSSVDPARRMAAFRGHVYRGARVAGLPMIGWLFAAIHGAYDPATETFPLHVHGIAQGGMIDVVRALRGLKVYAPAQPFEGRDAANTPVVVSRKSLSNMPAPASYALQRWWPERETYVDDDGLRKAYGGPRRAIRGPAYAEYLTFLNRCRLEDLTLLMGMHVTKGGLAAR